MKKKTIAVIIDRMDGMHQQLITKALIQQEKKLPVSLIFFTNISLNQPQINDMDFNFIYDLPINANVDGYIVVLCSYATYSGSDMVNSVISKYQEKPLVSISVPVETGTTVMLDNHEAMTSILSHILETMDLSEVAYISGPLSNYEAMIRYEVYKSYFVARDQLPKNEMVYFGTFLEESGREAVEYFRQGNAVFPKAIVCANDGMAIGAINRLNELGINVPDEVKVTGFDDTEDAKEFFPPMTTYAQNYEEMSLIALEKIFGMTGKGSITETILVPGHFVIRESCGCTTLIGNIVAPLEERQHNITDTTLSFEEHLKGIAPKIREYIRTFIGVTYAHINFEGKYTRELIDSLIQDVYSDSYDSMFVKTLSKLVNSAMRMNSDSLRLLELADMLTTTVASLPRTIEEQLRLTYIFIQTEKFIGDRLVRIERNQQFLSSNRNKRMHLISREMYLATSLESFYEIVEENLSVLSISEFYVLLFDNQKLEKHGGKYTFPSKVKLDYAYHHKRLQLPEEVIIRDILPEEARLGMENPYLVMSVFDNTHHYGYMIISFNEQATFSLESIRAKLVELLREKNLKALQEDSEYRMRQALKELQQSNAILSHMNKIDTLTGLYNRRGFYELAIEAMEEGKASHKGFFLVYGDLDRLKKINDLHGHKEGDYAIIKTGEILRDMVECPHILSRMSGDEFTMIVHTNKKSDIDQLFARIRAACEDHNRKSGKNYNLTISLGSYYYDPSHEINLDELLSLADQELYKHKNTKLF